MKSIFTKFLVLTMCCICSASLTAQCTNATMFPPSSVAINTAGGVVTINTCNFAGEYSVITGAVSGQTLQFTYSLAGGFITVRSGSVGGPVLASGNSPLSFNNTFTGTLYVHWNTNAACGTNSSCSTTTVQCTSCTPPPPPTCPAGLGAGTVTIASLPYSATGLTNCGNGNNVTASNATVCGNTSYYGGEDKTFIFTPAITGSTTISLTTASSYVGLTLYAGCPFSGQGGTCVGNVQTSTGSKTLTVTLTAGTTYYLIVDSWPSPNCHPSFNLSIAPTPPPPANDDCAGAFVLVPSSNALCTLVNGTTISATQSIPAIMCGSFTGNANDDVWYQFTATSNFHTVTVNGAAGFDAVVDVRSGACNGTSIACVDATLNAATEVVNLSDLTIGQTYLVRVYDFYSNPGGFFTICVTTPASCVQPGTPMATAVTHNSATLSWAAAMGATQYRYSYGSGAHVCGTGGTNTANTSVNLTGLSPNTIYTFCVRTNACGGDVPSSYVSTTFTTEPPCGIPLEYPWSLYNIGGSTGSGLDNEQCAGTIELSSAGFGTVTGPDKHTFAGQCFCGDGSIKAKLESVTNKGWGGIIFRATSDAGSMKVGMRTQLSNVFMRDIRTTTNGLAQQVSLVRPTNPMWMRITRTGNNFVGETSVNGTSWAFAFTVTIPNMPECIEAGLYTQSVNNNVTATATFSNVMLMGDRCNGEPQRHSDQNLTIRTVKAALDYSLYPNPANDVLNIQWNEAFISKAAYITIVNQIGQVVHSLKIPVINNDTETLQIDNLSDGLYIMSVRSGDAQILHRKFMVHSIRP